MKKMKKKKWWFWRGDYEFPDDEWSYKDGPFDPGTMKKYAWTLTKLRPGAWLVDGNDGGWREGGRWGLLVLSAGRPS